MNPFQKDIDCTTMEIFLAYTNLILALLELIDNSKGDSNEADIIRDEISDLFDLLSEEEKQYVKDLTGDLYMVYNREMYFSVTDKERYKNILVISIHNQDWITVLEMLRFNLGLSSEYIAAYRGRAWSEGKYKHLKIALKFYLFAEQLNPGFYKECIIDLKRKMQSKE